MADIIVRPLSDSSTTITVSKGFIGPPGRAATATVGTTTTGAAGSNASVTNVGTLFDAVFDFVIPKGDTGDAATIAVGTVTALNPDQSPTVTNSGTSGAAVFDFGLPNAATLDLGTVTIVDPDQSPSVTDVGTNGNVVLDINIPRAADVTVQSAVTLTPDQNPSVADNGVDGDVNLTFSIPRAAAININPVTEVNPDVSPSVTDTGVNGDVDLTFSIPRAATLDLGTITVVDPDQNPAIADVGTNGDAVFNFSLPRAATITLNTTTVVNPDVNPSVADTGTDGDAVYTFSLPRAAALALGTVSVLNPDQSPIITSSTLNGDVTFNFGVPRAADVSVGSVTQLSAGTTPTVTDSGTDGDVVLDFGLPQGEAATISVGTVSTVNPDQNPSVTNVGSTSVAVLDFDLPRASTFTVGTVTTGAAGSSATITDIGTNGDVVLDFSIPKGDKGDQGDKGDTGDAATLDLGTVSVVNPDVNPSVTNVGTTSAAIFDIDLPRVASVSIGTVNTVEFDVGATVTNVGTNGDVVLDFDIPRGTIGVDGAPGIVIDSVAPSNTDVLWADTSELGENVLPIGGTTGQYLNKASDSDFDAQWVTPSFVDAAGAISAIKGDADWNATDWDTAFGWGDHAAVGYLEPTDIGVTVQGYDVNTAKYDDTTANFTGTLQEGGNNVVTANEVGTIASQDANSVNIDGGNIDGTPIGVSSASSGAFTTLTASDDVNFNSGTLFVDASGNRVGIGTTSPASVNGTTDNSVVLNLSNLIGATLNVEGDFGRIFLTDTNATANSRIYEVMSSDGSLSFSQIDDAISVRSERMRIDSSGHAIIPAGVTLGTAAGVYNAANTLDDYETGTFTPGVSDESGNTSSGSINSGEYTKIGNIVYVRILLGNVDTTGLVSSDMLKITGLPFNANSFHPIGAPRVDNVTFTDAVIAQTEQDANTARLLDIISGGNDNAILVSAYTDDGADIDITGWYFTNS